MEDKKELYKKSQYAYWIYIVCSIIIVILYLQYDQDTFIYPAGILVIVGIIFYKLTIRITTEEIAAYFGFGLFKRKMKLSEIDYSSIQKIEIKWYTGIGIRYTTHGWLYNVKLGDAIKIVSKNRKKTFFVGTDDFNTIDRLLANQLQNKEA